MYINIYIYIYIYIYIGAPCTKPLWKLNAHLTNHTITDMIILRVVLF